MKTQFTPSVLNHRLQFAERRATNGRMRHTWQRVARILKLKLVLTT